MMQQRVVETQAQAAQPETSYIYIGRLLLGPQRTRNAIYVRLADQVPVGLGEM
jgi:hypothetical protein